MQQRILAVDDMPQITILLKDALATVGYEVDTAASGYEALKLIGERAYDLIIMDMLMPQICGKELYKNFINLCPNLSGKIMFSTGDTFSRETFEFLKGTGCPYIFKPFTLKELIETVNTVLKGSKDVHNTRHEESKGQR